MLVRALLDVQVGTGASQQRLMGVFGARRGLELPHRRHLRRNTAYGVGQLAVAENIEGTVGAYIFFEEVWILMQARYAPELIKSQLGGPSPGAEHFDVLAPVHGLIGKTFPL